MGTTRRGFSTVECLVALTLFNLGLLAALATFAASVRLAHRGDHAAAGARLLLETLDQLRASLHAAVHRCATLSGGDARRPTGERVEWAVYPASHGVSVRLRLLYPTTQGERADTLSSFLPCVD
jgi:type II secretory pathway component PulJ